MLIYHLTQLLKAYNGDWVSDWKSDEIKCIIRTLNNDLGIGYGKHIPSFFSFKTEELRDEFLKNFRNLIMKAKPFL